MSKDESLGNLCVGNDVSNNENVSVKVDMCAEPKYERKSLMVETYSEVFYPSVSIVRASDVEKIVVNGVEQSVVENAYAKPALKVEVIQSENKSAKSEVGSEGTAFNVTTYAVNNDVLKDNEMTGNETIKVDELTNGGTINVNEATNNDPVKVNVSAVNEANISNESNGILTDVIEKSETPLRRRSGFKIWKSRLGTLLVGIVAVFAVVLVGMRLAGFRTFTVMSGSMEPNYPVGALIYVQPVDYKNLQVGDVISFVANDDKTVVTHRIINIEVDADDSSILRYKTKGDANAAADSKLVHYKNVLGTPIITIPFIGYFAHNIQQPPGIYIALVAGTLLLAWTFLPGTLEERRKTARKSVA